MAKKSFPLSKVYGLLEPGPVIMVTTARDGNPNIMTMSWHTMMEFEPPQVGCVISNRNYSFDLLKATKECVINIPAVWSLAYGLIIATEFLTGALLLVGAIGLLKNIHSRLGFNKGKNWVCLGCLVGFLLWFFGFIVVGGEWFCMWQSEKWNGVEAAFRFVVLIMLTLLFITMPESENDKK